MAQNVSGDKNSFKVFIFHHTEHQYMSQCKPVYHRILYNQNSTNILWFENCSYREQYAYIGSYQTQQTFLIAMCHQLTASCNMDVLISWKKIHTEQFRREVPLHPGFELKVTEDLQYINYIWGSYPMFNKYKLIIILMCLNHIFRKRGWCSWIEVKVRYVPIFS